MSIAPPFRRRGDEGAFCPLKLPRGYFAKKKVVDIGAVISAPEQA